MDPVTAVFVGIVIGGGLLLEACDSGTSGSQEPGGTTGPNGGGNDGGGEGPGEVDGSGGDEDLGEVEPDASDGDGGAEGDPAHERDGFNGAWSIPTYEGMSCDIRDLDLIDGRMRGLCGPTVNRLFSVDIDSDDPMGDHRARFGGEVADRTSGGTPFVTEQLICYDGDAAVVPFVIESNPERSGIVFVRGGRESVTNVLVPFSVIEGEEAFDYEPFSALSGFFQGERLLLAASDRESGGSVLVGYDFIPTISSADARLDQRLVAVLAELGGAEAIATVPLGEESVAVVTDDAIAGPQLHEIDLAAETPASAVVQSIPLSGELTGAKVVPLPELPISSDPRVGSFVVVPVRGFNDKGMEDIRLQAVGLEQSAVIDSASVLEEPRDLVFIRPQVLCMTGAEELSCHLIPRSQEYKALLKANGYGENNPDGTAVTYDNNGLHVGSNLGAMVAHVESGVVFIAAGARWFEGRVGSDAPRKYIIALDLSSFGVENESAEADADAGIEGDAEFAPDAE